jgi:hypothetical protein
MPTQWLVSAISFDPCIWLISGKVPALAAPAAVSPITDTASGLPDTLLGTPSNLMGQMGNPAQAATAPGQLANNLANSVAGTPMQAASPVLGTAQNMVPAPFQAAAPLAGSLPGPLGKILQGRSAVSRPVRSSCALIQSCRDLLLCPT